jgi:hypothetical protein
VDAALGNGPLNLVAERLDTEGSSIQPGNPVRLRGDTLAVGDHEPVGAEPPYFSLRESRKWDPHLRVRAEELNGEAVAACGTLVEAEGPIESLAILLPVVEARSCTRGLPSSWQQAALAGMRPLLRGLRTGNVDEIRTGVRRLCGLGPGLTPSGDDFLVGVLIGLYLTGGDPQPVLQAATETTRISRAYLEAAADGQANEPWHDLLRALRSRSGWEPPARRLLRFGQTSGADMMTGFFGTMQ